MLTGVTMITVRTVRLVGQALILLPSYIMPRSFYSGRWNTGTNPDLAFACVGPNSCLPDRRVLEKLPRSQHRPSLITRPRFAMVVPGMPVTDPKSYRPISLLCFPYKILERLIYAHVAPLIDPLLPKEQAGFRRGKSIVDQVVLRTPNIEDSFEDKNKAGAVFVDLTAAYDTVWHRSLTSSC